MHLSCAFSAGIFFKRANVQYLFSSPLILKVKEDTCEAKIDGHKAKGPPCSADIPPRKVHALLVQQATWVAITTQTHKMFITIFFSVCRSHMIELSLYFKRIPKNTTA